MANVINMGAGGASFVNATVGTSQRIVYSDGYETKDITPSSEQSVSVLCNSLVYVPDSQVSGLTPTSVTSLFLATQDFTISKPLDALFSNNTWAEIASACVNKTVPDTWAVGNIRNVQINGTDYGVAIIGKNHDTYASGGTAPLTFQIIGPLPTSYVHTGGSWSTCTMRNTTLPNILASLPDEIKNAIREVSKFTANKSGNKLETTDKLFLLSEYEVFGMNNYSIAVTEDTLYPYYTYENKANRNRWVNRSYVNWWLRSSSKTTNNTFVFAQSASNPYAYRPDDTSYKCYVSPAFCF